MLAISPDSPQRSRELAKEHHLEFPLLSDPDLEIIRRWGVADEENGTAWPAVFIVGRDGRIAWRSLAQTYKVRPLSAELLDHL